jgi:hypothetical protein
MMRLVPLVLVGIVVLVLGFALSSGILTVVGGVLIAAGVVWFVMTGTGTRLGGEATRR